MSEKEIQNLKEGESRKSFFSKLTRRRVILYSIFTVIGIVGGYLYYRLVGCNGGCPITSSPYLSMLWGGLIGFLVPGVFEKPKK